MLKIKIPKTALKVVKRWDCVYLSPFSNSLYNQPIDENHQFSTGCQRLSDHWNYYKNGKAVFKTDKSIPLNHWALARNAGGLWIVEMTTPNKNTKSFHVEDAVNIRERLLAPSANNINHKTK